jgi:hypothetical protein
MSDQFLALFLTLGLLILLLAWVPFLDFLQHIVRQFREGHLRWSPLPRRANTARGYNAPERPAQREM